LVTVTLTSWLVQFLAPYHLDTLTHGLLTSCLYTFVPRQFCSRVLTGRIAASVTHLRSGSYFSTWSAHRGWITLRLRVHGAYSRLRTSATFTLHAHRVYSWFLFAPLLLPALRAPRCLSVFVFMPVTRDKFAKFSLSRSFYLHAILVRWFSSPVSRLAFTRSLLYTISFTRSFTILSSSSLIWFFHWTYCYTHIYRTVYGLPVPGLLVFLYGSTPFLRSGCRGYAPPRLRGLP